MTFVLDASAALPWCFLDEAVNDGLELELRLEMGEEAIVPAYWPTEILSGALRGKRRGRVDEAGVQLFLDNLASYSIRVAQPPLLRELPALKLLSELLLLNPYDAAYLSLAQVIGVPLATEDAAHARAALVEGVGLISNILP